ncbi:hypothetical protein [Gordonia iterans]
MSLAEYARYRWARLVVRCQGIASRALIAAWSADRGESGTDRLTAVPDGSGGALHVWVADGGVVVEIGGEAALIDRDHAYRLATEIASAAGEADR